MKSKKFPVKDGDFKMSSYTTAGGAWCVQVANKPQGTAVRDSKDKKKTTLFFTKHEWEAFIRGAKEGQFDN